MRSLEHSGFSLVEVVVSLGVAAVILVSLMALLPMGIKTSKTSAEETRAALILSTLEADLRNSHPLVKTNGSSLLFGLTLPYKMNANGTRPILNTDVLLNTVNAAYSTGLNEDEIPVDYTKAPRPRYQATVVYINKPNTGDHGEPLQARLIVNWPAVDTTDIAKLISPADVAGYVEAYVAFPAP